MNATRDDAAGSGLEEAVTQLVSRFGSAAVANAAKRLASGKSGRKPDPDLERLGAVLKQDARDILEGRERKSNYAIAKAFALKHPGHSQDATHKRIERKLRKDRGWIALLMAAHHSATGYPYAIYLEVLEQLASPDNAERSETAKELLAAAQNELSAYRDRFGEPMADMSMSSIAEAVRPSIHGPPRTALLRPASLIPLGTK